jgi:hypothetical protein
VGEVLVCGGLVRSLGLEQQQVLVKLVSRGLEH